mgnify:CR=1 FL=1
MIKTKLVSIALLLFISTFVDAIPAKKVKKVVTLANGSQTEMTLQGDEHFSYYIDKDGTPYVSRIDGTVESTTFDNVEQLWSLRKKNRLEKAYPSSSSKRLSPKKAGKPSSATTGKHRGLVILMQFKDVSFVTPNPKATFTRFFNESGYSDYGMSGSVKDYFLSQSYGQLEIDFDVVGPFTTKNNMAWYGEPEGDSNDARPAYMVAEAIDAASAEVDFTYYDWDGDGEVDQVFVVYAGYNQAQSADVITMWPHEWSLHAQGLTRTYNRKTITTYGCSSELMGNGKTNTGVIDGIGTACHEFSHCLGLPDMYDTSTGNRNFGMSTWDVMDQGSYNDNSRTPAGYTSYERIFSGWMEPTEIHSMILTRITNMKPLATTPEAYILYNDANKNEYYLLENRQLVGFDRGLYGHGLIVLHVDYDEDAWISNSVNNLSNHQRMTVIPADGRLTNSTLAGDPWPGTSGNQSLTNYTTPAATLYNNNVDGTKLMSKPIDNITENTAEQTVSFVVCRPELDIPMPDDGKEQEGNAAFTVTWPAVSGAVSYELELTEIGKAADNPDEALVREFDFSGCVSKTTGFSDISSKLVNYGLSGWTGSKLYTTPNKLRLGTSSTSGNVRTPTWYVPESTEMTIVIGAAPGSATATVYATLQLCYGNSGEQATVESVPFEVTADGKRVFHFKVRKDLFYLIIQADKWMYLNYLAIYDGTWTAEQLGIADGGNAKGVAPRLATTTSKYTTTTNSYTFANLNATSRYIYRVRALGEENTYSNWSEEKTFVFSAAGIDKITVEDQAAQVYDATGRLLVSTSAATLGKGIFIVKQNGKTRKVINP